MKSGNDDDQKLLEAMNEAVMASKYAENIDEIYIDVADLNADLCPPDRRFYKHEKEAWVYEHGNISELVFVKREHMGE